MIASGNLFAGLPASALEAEDLQDLCRLPGVRLERIVSTGQATPDGAWLNQKQAEWVVLLAGSAALLIEGEPAPRMLAPGDWLFLPPHLRHRVAWTSADPPAVWLAIHIG